MTIRSFSMMIAVCWVCTAGALAQTSTAVTYKYATLNYPGASSTTANGINNNNAVVGSYVDSSNVTHGFKWRSGTFTTIDFPGAISTVVSGINDFGDLVGTYELTPFSAHGFRLHNGTFKTIDFPGAGGSSAVGINNAGTIVGNYGNSHGFVYQNGTYKTLDAPLLNSDELPDTQLNGINNLGWVVGQVFTGDFWRGFWYLNGEFDFLEPPYSLDNWVSAANGRGDIVGSCYTGFIAFAVESSEGSESTEKFPPRESLGSRCPTGINYARVIVGNASGAFLGTPVLTLNVTSPANHSTHTNPVHVAATASGVNPIAQIQVWVNFKEIYHMNGGTLNANLNLPVGAHERLVVQAVDSKGVTAKVTETITVN
jgi:uncharacterized membrane protein